MKCWWWCVEKRLLLKFDRLSQPISRNGPTGCARGLSPSRKTLTIPCQWGFLKRLSLYESPPGYAIFLWYIGADPKLPASFVLAIRNPENSVYLSVASIWEVIIKHKAGKFPLLEDPETFLSRQRKLHQIGSLPFDEPTLANLAKLPTIHRDPFDHLLIAQAIQHGLTLVSLDEILYAYPVAFLKP